MTQSQTQSQGGGPGAGRTLTVRHVTRYAWDSPVDYALQQLRLTPKSRAGQEVLSWDVAVEGGRVELTFEDSHANTVDLVSVTPGATEVVLTSTGIVRVEDRAGLVGRHGGWMPLWMFLRATPLTEPDDAIRALVPAGTDGLDRLHRLMAAVREAVSYGGGATDAMTGAAEALTAGQGVCQDQAHVFVAAARSAGIPARYVSGYLDTSDPTAGNATHAWAEAHVDGLGWTGFDVTNGISPDARYVRVATGLDYRDAAPVTGRRRGGDAETLSVDVSVQQ